MRIAKFWYVRPRVYLVQNEGKADTHPLSSFEKVPFLITLVAMKNAVFWDVYE
jgi:hypothetical protein